MRRNYLKTGVCLLMAFCLALGGCAKVEQPVETEAPLVLPTPTPEPQARAGGELRLPMPSNAQINAPFTVNTEEMLGFYSLIYESLVTLDATGHITACLAEHWSCDGTGRVWEFSLRTARWHDTGEKLTAADVVFTYERILSLGSNSYYAYNISGIESMQAVNETTLSITMKQAGIAALYALIFPIVRSDIDTGTTLRPIGTGPYKVESIGSESVLLLVNENWWKQSPYIQSISFFERANNDTALASYAAGQLDMTPTSNVAVGKYREEGVTKVQDVMTQTAEMLIVNNSNQDLRDLRVRKAIAYALDRSAIITNVYMNRAQACDVPVAPDSWLYEAKSKLYDHDETESTRLLGEAGWIDIDEDGVLDKAGEYNTTLSLRLLVCDGADSTRRTAADMIKSQLEAVGLVVEVETATYSLGNSESPFLQKLRAGEFDLALMGMNVSRNADMRELIGTGGSCNYGRYTDAALEKMAYNIMTAGDEAAYRSAASVFQLQFAEDLPNIVLYFRLNSIVYTAELQGLGDIREPNLFANIEKWYMHTDAE